MERSAEWLRGAVESHINTCNLITSITSATKSHPARQGLLAAGNELHNQLDRYRALLAEAEAREAREARVLTAAEVIAAAERALEVWKEDSATGVGTDASCPCLECKTYRQLGALIADWKAGRG